MKILILIFAIIVFSSSWVSADIQVTQEQFDNLGIIHEKIQDRYSKFKGFEGTKDKLKCIGVSDETVLSEIEIIDIPTEIQKKKAEKDAKKLKKFQEGDKYEDKIDEIIDYLNKGE